MATSSNPKVPKPNYSEKAPDFLIEEFSALRTEIQNRTATQHQLISLAIIATGTCITFGLQSSSTIALIYPILGLFIAILWVQHDYNIRQIGEYISKRIEPRFLGENSGWEHRPPPISIGKASFTFFATSGIFIGTQVLTIVVGLIRTSFSLADIVLLAIDAIVILLTTFVIRKRQYNFKF